MIMRRTAVRVASNARLRALPRCLARRNANAWSSVKEKAAWLCAPMRVCAKLAETLGFKVFTPELETELELEFELELELELEIDSAFALAARA
jgi:hypothetical protein